MAGVRLPARKLTHDHSAVANRPPTLLEIALRRERLSLAVVLVGIPLACWIWIVVMARDMYGPMTGSSAWMMTLVWDAPRLLLLWVMWAAMMAGMMLPSAAPLVLLYAGAARRRASESRPTLAIHALAAGYLVVWACFSVGATILQRTLSRLLLLTPMMEPATPVAGAVVLLIAGVYQLTPLKRVCLHACRSPLAFLTHQWRPGVSGAFRMGVEHGLYCLGCCWALMLLLFAGGVMNLAVIVALTAWVIVEKLAPFGEQSARVSGALLIALAGWILFR
jgi:predicted metal-binding membrane protein